MNSVFKGLNQDHKVFVASIIKADAAALQKYVESGMDFSKPLNDLSQSAIFFAVMSNRLPIVKFVVNAGGNVNAVDVNGLTPAHAACELGNAAILRLLCDEGAVLTVRDNQSRTAVTVAFTMGKRDVIDVIMSTGLDIMNPTDKSAFTPLIAVSTVGNIELVRWLLEQKADVNYLIDKGSALHYAAMHNRLVVVKELLANKADPHVGDFQGTTPLHHALGYGNVSAAELICAAGGSLTKANDKGDTPIEYAMAHCSLTSARFVIKQNNNNINATDHFGSTLLHYAAFKNKLDVAQWLVEQGIDVKIRNKKGETAFDKAVQVGSVEVMDYLAPLEDAA